MPLVFTQEDFLVQCCLDFCTKFCVDQLRKWHEVIVSVVELITGNISLFDGSYFDAKKNTGKKLRTQGRHREFCLDWSVATLIKVLGPNPKFTLKTKLKRI